LSGVGLALRGTITAPEGALLAAAPLSASARRDAATVALPPFLPRPFLPPARGRVPSPVLAAGLVAASAALLWPSLLPTEACPPERSIACFCASFILRWNQPIGPGAKTGWSSPLTTTTSSSSRGGR